MNDDLSLGLAHRLFVVLDLQLCLFRDDVLVFEFGLESSSSIHTVAGGALRSCLEVFRFGDRLVLTFRLLLPAPPVEPPFCSGATKSVISSLGWMEGPRFRNFCSRLFEKWCIAYCVLVVYKGNILRVHFL